MTPARFSPTTVQSPPAAVVPPSLDTPSLPTERLAALALGFFFALQGMLANEFLAVYLGLPIPILILAALPVLLLSILSGRLGRFWQCGIVLPYLTLLLWLWACTVLGSFKGFYVGMVMYGFRFHLTPFVVCGIASSFGLLRTVVTGYAVGAFGALLLCAKFGQIDSAGRLGIPDTSLLNPNDLALNLLIGLAILSVFAFDSNIFKRLLWLVCFAMTLLFVLRTGSRANLVTLGIMLLVIFVTSKSNVRIAFLTSTLLLGTIMFFIIPAATRVRLTTFFSFSEEDYSVNSQVANAATSTEARKQLQIRAFKIAIQHPIFGVGPHMFLYSLDDFMRNEEGANKGTWLHSHNTYLDLAAETGFPGVLLYCLCMFWCIRTNYQNFQRSQKEVPLSPFLGISISLMMASIALAVGTLFCSWTYWATYCYLVGLTAASQLILRDYDRRRMAAAGPPPALFPGMAPFKNWRTDRPGDPRR